MPKQINEAGSPGQGIGAPDNGGKAIVTIITPGEGSSGIYPPETLEAAAEDKVFPAGTHMHINHPTEAEQYERPEGDVRSLAAVLTEDARWTGEALEASARIFPAYLTDLSAMAESIGVSIRGSAEFTPGKPGEKPTIDRITEINSVDFVTFAGRGGSFRIQESRQRAFRAAVQRTSESTANQERSALYAALRDKYNAEKTYAWLRDYDESHVWFEFESPDQSGLFQLAYSTGSDGAVTFTGDPVEVREQITYVPVTPAGSDTTESREDTMPQIEEARLRELEEASGRVSTVEADNAQLRRELNEARAHADAAPILDRLVAESGLEGANRRTVVAACSAPTLTGSGELDAAAYEAAIGEAIETEKAFIAKEAESAGAGTPAGLGAGSSKPGEVTEADIDKRAARVFNVKGA